MLHFHSAEVCFMGCLTLNNTNIDRETALSVSIARRTLLRAGVAAGALAMIPGGAHALDVRIFQDGSELPHHATVFWIKEPPQQAIPTAVSPCLSLLDSVSVTIPAPVAIERGLSAEYRMAVQRESERLRPTLTLATVARRYLGFAAELQTDAPAIPRDAISYELDCQ